jgi:RNA polymerase sigma factor FliA
MAPAIASHTRDGGNLETRERLIGQHLGLVYHVARRLVRGKQMQVELEELVSAGSLGLIEAFNNFDPSRGLAFSTFAAPRIRGAILDELRRLDQVPRSVRRRMRALSATREELTRELGHAPDNEQVARRMGVDMSTFWRWQSEGEEARFVPLGQGDADDTSNGRMALDHIPATSGTEIDDRLTLAQEGERLRAALAELPDQERHVLTLCYFEELKLHEIAKILGVSESRVSQIRAKAVQRLRKQLAGLRVA